MAKENLLPGMVMVIDMPDVVAPGVGSQALARAMTEAGKAQLDIEIQRHHRRRVPRHFREGNRTRYKHFQRSRFTRLIKARAGYGRTDLVKTKMTRDVITAGWKRKHIGGSIKWNKNKSMSGGLRATLYFRFPFKTNFRNVADQGKPHYVNPLKMALELEAWAPDEIEDVTKSFRRGYLYLLRRAMNRRRVSKRIQAKIGALSQVK